MSEQRDYEDLWTDDELADGVDAPFGPFAEEPEADDEILMAEPMDDDPPYRVDEP